MAVASAARATAYSSSAASRSWVARPASATTTLTRSLVVPPTCALCCNAVASAVASRSTASRVATRSRATSARSNARQVSTRARSSSPRLASSRPPSSAPAIATRAARFPPRSIVCEMPIWSWTDAAPAPSWGPPPTTSAGL
jgi:hypothetical protein